MVGLVLVVALLTVPQQARASDTPAHSERGGSEQHSIVFPVFASQYNLTGQRAVLLDYFGFEAGAIADAYVRLQKHRRVVAQISP